MNHTNLLTGLFLASFVYTNTVKTTNWVNTGDLERRRGTNYVEQWLSEISSIDYREEVAAVITYKTNRVPIQINRQVFSQTNSVTRMTPSGTPPLPPTPGVPTKL